MRFGWDDLAIMGIGCIIGYFTFSGIYEESFVLWRAQKMENLLTTIEKFSEEKASQKKHLEDIEAERRVYSEKLSAIRSKCCQLRDDIEKLMKSRTDTTTVKRAILARTQIPEASVADVTPTDKSELVDVKEKIAQVIQQLGPGIKGPNKVQVKQMLRNSRDEIVAKRRIWRIQLDLAEIEQQLKSESRLSELKKLGLSDSDDS
ncbi:unnamed protein product [Notodromas monacha]|uniref:Uncharacterized protein n=1 Tax=Notodromas monacha TaxID=399045 RepID=A0A7R9BUG6_9CRUS|nr:unnamed protein product [Notodromas monacha]CAG0920905.1 unnamed protein product [Notodromas monacha]